MYHLREAQTKCFQFTVLFPFQHQVVASGGSLSPWRGARGPKVSGAGGIEGPGRRAEESGAGGGGRGGPAAWQPLRPTCSGADREEVDGASWVEPAGRLLSARLLGPPSPRSRAVLSVVCGSRARITRDRRQGHSPPGLCVLRRPPRHPSTEAPAQAHR